MMQRIHIFGASGSGTTTLGKGLADALGWPHYDTDSYYWVPTDPPFQTVRDCAERQQLLRQDLARRDAWVPSGSLCGWGDFLIPLFQLAVFLWLPAEVRLERLRKRELTRYGPHVEDPDHPRYQNHQAFLAWAAAYDAGGLDMRSKTRHEAWMATLPCPVLRLDQAGSLQANVMTVLATILRSQKD